MKICYQFAVVARISIETSFGVSLCLYLCPRTGFQLGHPGMLLVLLRFRFQFLFQFLYQYISV